VPFVTAVCVQKLGDAVPKTFLDLWFNGEEKKMFFFQWKTGLILKTGKGESAIAQLLLGKRRCSIQFLLQYDLYSRPKSMIFMSFKRQYATFCD